MILPKKLSGWYETNIWPPEDEEADPMMAVMQFARRITVWMGVPYLGRVKVLLDEIG